MACCKACSIGATKRKRTMARRRKLKITDLAMKGAGVAGGIVVGKLVINNIPVQQIQTSPALAGGLQLLAGAFAYNQKGELVKNIGIGMAANGVVDLIKGLAGPDVATSLGISGIGAFNAPYSLQSGSTMMPGVAGRVGKYSEAMQVRY